MSFIVKITRTKLERPVCDGTLFQEVDGFEVKSYKDGKEIDFDRKYFYLNEKKEAGLYALALENFYKHFQED